MVRDAMLAVSGLLDSRLAGPSFQDHDSVKAPGTPAISYVPVDPARRVWPPNSLSRLDPRRTKCVS